MKYLGARVLGPVSFVLLASAAACGTGSTSTALSINGLPEAGLVGGYDATLGSAGDDGGPGGSNGSSSSGSGDDTSSGSTPAGDDGSQTSPTPDDASVGGDDGGGSSGASGSSSGSGSGSGSGSSGASGGGSSSGGLECLPCQTNLDCQNSCPPVSGGFNCCDVTSGTCFASQTKCPNANDAAPE